MGLECTTWDQESYALLTEPAGGPFREGSGSQQNWTESTVSLYPRPHQAPPPSAFHIRVVHLLQLVSLLMVHYHHPKSIICNRVHLLLYVLWVWMSVQWHVFIHCCGFIQQFQCPESYLFIIILLPSAPPNSWQPLIFSLFPWFHLFQNVRSLESYRLAFFT